MRTAFIETLTEAAAKDPRVMLIVGDLGFNVVTEFAERFPRQFLNVGVAEQNMTGVAAGLALNGKVAFTYSIANFSTIRCLEQIRNDVCHHRANVVVVAVGAGYSYGALGMTHHATEDLAIMRVLPNMTVIAPGDTLGTREATRAAAAGIGPVYLSLGRTDEPSLFPPATHWELGKALTARQGGDVTLISTGDMLHATFDAANRLAEAGIEARVLHMHTLKPLDEEAVLAAARDTQRIVTIEEHSIIGGLGGAVAEVLCEAGVPNVRFLRIGLACSFGEAVGDQHYLRGLQRLDVPSICRRVREFLA
jgi:transketolase